jgi:hypothetical protein
MAVPLPSSPRSPVVAGSVETSLLFREWTPRFLEKAPVHGKPLHYLRRDLLFIPVNGVPRCVVRRMWLPISQFRFHEASNIVEAPTLHNKNKG